MNNLDNKVENVSDNKEATWPHTVLTRDKDDNLVPVEITEGTAQDKEYSEDKNGN